ERHKRQKHQARGGRANQKPVFPARFPGSTLFRQNAALAHPGIKLALVSYYRAPFLVFQAANGQALLSLPPTDSGNTLSQVLSDFLPTIQALGRWRFRRRRGRCSFRQHADAEQYTWVTRAAISIPDC